MADFVEAFRSDTGEPAEVPAKWVDNPHIFGGAYVSKQPKSSRSRRESVESKVADEAAPAIESDPVSGATTPEE